MIIKEIKGIKGIKVNDNNITNNKIIKVNNKYDKMNDEKNYIIAELDIKEDKQNIRIINTYEQYTVF